MGASIKPFLQDIGAAAYQLGYEIYIVGGYVRNKLYAEFYNKPARDNCTDIDLVINTNAIEFTHRLERYLEDNHPQHHTFNIIEEFQQFGTIKIEHPDYPCYKIELASTRTEVYEDPAAFPKVTIIDNIQDDLERRDFTINALLESINPPKAKNPFGEIVDYVGGLKDLQQGIIRVFHDDSFIDDPTRIYRAARFMAEYNFTIEPHSLELIRKAVAHKDFSQWLQKRKTRFIIELEKIEKLGEERALCAKNLLSSLGI
jgi:tRNA nucleotidyltransferase (CCA-adding enzyme)